LVTPRAATAAPLRTTVLVTWLRDRQASVRPVRFENKFAIEGLKWLGYLPPLDPQGYFRRLAVDGSVQIKNWNDSRVLKKMNALKVSCEEFTALAGRGASMRILTKLGPDIVLMTKGAKGSIVWSREEGTFKVPAYKTRVVDPTGARDAMAGAFLVSWHRTNDLVWSAAIGSAVASFVIEKSGLANFGTRQQIQSRAEAIFEQTMRL
jgi:hypothetical protein